MSDPILTLEQRIPEVGFADEEEAMEAFLDWVTDRGITPYPAQEEAILEVFSDSHVILKTPTGSGKSLVATAMLFRAFARARRSIYTAPIKALVSEKFFALCGYFGAENVGMMTGDGGVNQGAPIICCTAEVLAHISLRYGAQTPYDAVVMDEFHYYGDRDRGMAWQLPLLTMPDARFLLMSATLGDTSHIAEDLEERTGATVAEVASSKRPVPLEFRYADTTFLETVTRLVSNRKAPVYVVHFSQRTATETAGALMSTNMCSKEEKRAISDALKGTRFSSPYGPALERFLRHGVGLHHAGLLPRYRMIVERLAQQGMLKVICGTDTLGVGINVPIRTVLFSQLCKYDGVSVDILTVRDFKQIAGRAGRKGFDDEGLVVAQAPAWIIDNQKVEEAVRTGQKKRKKVVKSQPPSRGYKHWDEPTFRRLIDSPPEPLESRFTIDYGLLLNLLQRADAEGTDAMAELRALIDASHTGEREGERLWSQAEALIGDLQRAGVLLLDESDGS
ncbi:MAG: superfamily II RNA helicase, partial [Myxococcota bacterium]